MTEKMNSTIPEALIESYIYPIFLAHSKEELIYRMSVGTIIYGILVGIMPKPAAYGKHSKPSSRYGVPPQISWVIQESPSFYIPLLLIYYGSRNDTFKSVANQMCIGMFMLHYFQRSFIFPILMKSKKPFPLGACISAFITTLYNGVLHGLYFVSYYSYSDKDWLMKPYFWVGFLMFLYGMSVNIKSDNILQNLRKGNTGEYKIPEGGMFRYVSCANYFGEIVEMWGYALASCAPPAIAFAFFTTMFLGRRAVHSHQWYVKKFENYPKDRKAVIPFIL